MKQCITVEQVNQLKDYAKVKLRYSLTRGNKWQEFLWEDIAKMLTIGKMIEMLGKRFVDLSKNLCKKDEYYVTIDFYMHDALASKTTFSSKEPCDALWEAVKEVLNEKI